MRKAAIGLALATTILATSAMARDGSMYAGIEGGVAFGDSLTVDYDADGDGDIEDGERSLVDLDTDMGWDFDAILGYDFGGFRIEGEAGYKKLDISEVESDAGFDLDPDTPAVDTAFGVDGDVTVKSLMLNALADFGADGGTQFYAGGGVGYGWVDLEGEIEDVAGPFVDDSDGGFAWQGIAGVRVPLSPSTDIGLKYRYFNVENLSMVSPGNDRFDTDFSSHSLLASLIFNFGAATPPPQTKTCPDGSVVGVMQNCPVPPAPYVPPTGERG
jgi:opacity protein-like surface antigen